MGSAVTAKVATVAVVGSVVAVGGVEERASSRQTIVVAVAAAAVAQAGHVAPAAGRRRHQKGSCQSQSIPRQATTMLSVPHAVLGTGAVQVVATARPPVVVVFVVPVVHAVPVVYAVPVAHALAASLALVAVVVVLDHRADLCRHVTAVAVLLV